MIYIFSLLMLFLCIYSIYRLIITPNSPWIMIGIIGAFSIGYYLLPVIFMEYSGLDKLNQDKLFDVFLMSTLFFLFLIIGVIFSNYYLNTKKNIGINFTVLDILLEKHYKVFFYIGMIIWLVYFFNVNLTSYSSDDIETFFLEKTKFGGLISVLANYGISLMSFSIAYVYSKDKKTFYLYFTIFIIISLLLLSTGQRLAVIKPIFMLVGAFSILGAHKFAVKLIAAGVLFLFLVSPFMVFVREYQGASGNDKIFEASKEFTISDSIENGLSSILDRADLLKVMIKLKDYVDSNTTNFNSSVYITSVLSSFIPSVIYPSKPYPVSDTGTIWGEISVIAWVLYKGKEIGSLTAFGAISAYREGGFLWVLFNGFLVGILFSIIFHLLAKGGTFSKFLFISIFVTLCVRNVPPSLSYFIIFLAPLVNVLIFSFFLNLFLKRVTRSHY